jgi:serine/threonine-protein phosphatase 2A regulatory subunit A
MLIDGLRSDDVETRVLSANSLSLISSGLGPDRTIDELIPFLADSIDDDDAVLLALSKSLPSLKPLLRPEQLVSLLKPLELLLTVEESTVRQQALVSLVSVLSDDASSTTDASSNTFPRTDLLANLPPLISRLGHSSFFTSRLSAAELLPVLLSHLDYANTADGGGDGDGNDTAASLADAKTLFETLSRDDTPMVRRAAYTVLPMFLKALPQPHLPHLTETLLPLFTSLAVDGQDSVRLITPDTTVKLVELLEAELQDKPASLEASTVVTQRLVPTFLSAASDMSWRVRWSCAENFSQLLKAIQPLELAPTDSLYTSLLAAYTALLRDPEPEVRSSAISSLPSLCTTAELTLTLLPSLPPLLKDTFPHVRSSLAAVLPLLSPSLGAEQTQLHLLPHLLPLLRDSDSGVRLALLANLKALNAGMDTLAQAVLPAVVELAEDTKWRVRQAVIEEVPRLAQDLGVTFFTQKFTGLCLTWLQDDVSAIRLAATENLRILAMLFGVQWTVENLISELHAMHEHPSYLRRLTALQAAAIMSELDEALTVSDLLPLVLGMATDAVPNIRFNVAKSLVVMAPHVPASALTDSVMPCLEGLREDKDNDVQYFSRVAIQQIKGSCKEKLAANQ